VISVQSIPLHYNAKSLTSSLKPTIYTFIFPDLYPRYCGSPLPH